MSTRMEEKIKINLIEVLITYGQMEQDRYNQESDSNTRFTSQPDPNPVNTTSQVNANSQQGYRPDRYERCWGLYNQKFPSWRQIRIKEVEETETEQTSLNRVIRNSQRTILVRGSHKGISGHMHVTYIGAVLTRTLNRDIKRRQILRTVWTSVARTVSEQTRIDGFGEQAILYYVVFAMNKTWFMNAHAI